MMSDLRPMIRLRYPLLHGEAYVDSPNHAVVSYHPRSRARYAQKYAVFEVDQAKVTRKHVFGLRNQIFIAETGSKAHFDHVLGKPQP